MNMADEKSLDRAKKLACFFVGFPLEKTELSPVVVSHPFFESAFMFDGEKTFNAFEGKELYVKQQQKIRNLVCRCENVNEIVAIFRKSFRLTFIYFLYREKICTKQECGNLLGKNWVLLENVSADINVRKRSVIDLLSAATKEEIMTDGELKTYKSFPKILTIYRGCDKREALKGLSWTLSKDTAIFFAERFGNKDKGQMYSAEIDKENALAYFNSRGEQEVVVDYRFLKNIKQIN